MTKYLGYWSTGSSYNREGIEFSSLREAVKVMRSIAWGNNTGSGARWAVYRREDVYTHGCATELAVRSGRV